MKALVYIIATMTGVIAGWVMIMAALDWLRGKGGAEERAFREHYDERERRSPDGRTLPPVK